MENKFILPERNEDKVIIYSARTEIDANSKKKLKCLLKKDLDWNYLIISACRNSVSTLVLYQLNKNFPEQIPSDYLNIFWDVIQRGIKYNLLLSAELINILKLMDEQNIHAVSYSGPVLANRVYSNLALKEINWLEIVIDENDIKKSKEILLQQGYELKYKPDPEKEQSFIETVHEYVFFKERDLIQIHLKWNYLKDSFSAPYNVENTFDYNRMIPSVFNGLKINNPSAEDLFIILAIKCAKLQWTRLAYICDIAELVRNNNSINWEKILVTANKYRILRIVFINLYLIKELLGVNIPQSLSNQMEDSPEIRKISIKLINRLFTHDDFLIKMRREYYIDAKLRYQIRENKYYGIKDFIKSYTSPGPYKSYKPPTKLSSASKILTNFINWFTKRISDRHPIITVPEPYVVTPSKVVVKMLQMADIKPGDVVYDLGCGDGRVVVTAASKFGVKGVGIDLEPDRIKRSNINSKKEGVEDLTTFIMDDIMESDISNASIVIMYHIPSINLAIRSKLKKELKPETRIVTREFSLGEWTPVKTEIVSNDGLMIPIYLYKI